MRPGVPWNVKGIEAEAREVAQLAARRAGVSLGEWLTGLIMTDGRTVGAAQSHAYQPQYLPGDGTYGPQPNPQYQPPPPVPNLRYPQTFPQQQPQAYPPQYPQGGLLQAAPLVGPAPHYPQSPFQQRDQAPQQPAYQGGQPQGSFPQGGHPQNQSSYEQGYRGHEASAFQTGLRDLADRFDQSERRAQQAIASVNQTVAVMQDRLDAAERVKQLADTAFSSAADALAQSARDQSKAFESLEATVRSVQKRISDVETGRAEWPGKESISQLETALSQLQRRLSEMEVARSDLPGKDTILKLEGTLNQLQARLVHMETASGDTVGRDALARLESSIGSMRNEVAEADRRTRDDITQMAKYMRDLGSRVEMVERGHNVADNISARFDALEARSASMFDEIRGQMSSMDGRIAQAASSKNVISPNAFAALKGSVEGIAARLDGMGDPTSNPLTSTVTQLQSTLTVLTQKIDQSEKRSVESVLGVNNSLKALASRIEESDKKNSQSLGTLTRRLDAYDQRAEDNAREIHNSLSDFTSKLETTDQRHKDAISAMRMQVDGLIGSKAADDVMRKQPMDGYSAGMNTRSRETSYAPPPPVNETADFRSPFDQPNSGRVDPPFSRDEFPPVAADRGGMSLKNVETLMQSTLSQHESHHDPHSLDDVRFGQGEDQRPDHEFDPPLPPNDLIKKMRSVVRDSAARADERASAKPAANPYDKPPGRHLGRLAAIAITGIAVVTGVVALLISWPSGKTEEGVQRPPPTSSLDDIINGKQPKEGGAALSDDRGQTPPAAEFAPLPPPEETGTVIAPPAGANASETVPAPSFTAGTGALPGSAKESEVAALESGSVRGDAKSQFLLSLRYSEGRGVEKDDARAASLATKAAEQGLPIAQYRLGALFERGIGVDKSLDQAKSWYEKAAKAGNRKAMHNLAVLHADASSGKPNYKEAARWFREGATLGLMDSQYNLAVLLERGMLGAKNVKEAAMWYAVAASQGDNGAAERLEQLKATLPIPDITSALESARAFKPKSLNPKANELPDVTG